MLGVNAIGWHFICCFPSLSILYNLVSPLPLLKNLGKAFEKNTYLGAYGKYDQINIINATLGQV